MIPQGTRDAIDRYVNERLPTGHFLRAVLENKLTEAFGRADDENTAAMKEIVDYLYNEVPFCCWGSPEKVAQWLRKE